MIRSILIFFIFIFIVDAVQAQESPRRCEWVHIFNKEFVLDSLSVIPHTLAVQHQDSLLFDVNYDISTGKALVITTKEVDSVQLCYEVLPYSFHQKFYHRNLEVYDSTAYFKDAIDSDGQILQREELLAIKGLQKSGSISRGVSFGNNQDVFVNSTLNLNLDGKLTDDLNIQASITDQNVPFQPEGNTQQLQDFDNVFIRAYNDNFSITGGDVVLKSRPSYFLKYYKNVQGGLAELHHQVGDSANATTSLGLSVAKGRFASVQIAPIEGVLGPYRIPGPNHEAFIIVLANSERVFLDGEQLTRGFNNDYIIDYNSGEITFTNHILITRFSRIRVDYEYSDQNYSRSIATASHYQERGKVRLFVNAYSEKDNRNKPLLMDLSREDKLLLSEIGDDLEQAVTSGADSIGYNNELILYAKVDTVDSSGKTTTIFKHSNDPQNAVYKVSFSNVGSGNGNYVQAHTTANGRVFQWVSPQGGVPQGQYEPVLNIPAPNKKQLVNIGSEFKITPYEHVFAEMAVSDQDINLFSTLSEGDDRGYAIKGGVVSEGRAVKFLSGYEWSAFTDFEFDYRYFTPIDRFRSIEYDRDWSFDPGTASEVNDDRIFNVGIGIKKSADNELHYQMSYRDRGQQINGFQHRAGFDKKLSKFQLRTNLFYLDNDKDSLRATWKRYSADVSYQSAWLIPGYVYQVDKNRVKSVQADSVVASAMYFDEHAFYLRNGKDATIDFGIRHSLREDKIPLGGELAELSKSNTTQFTLSKDMENHQVAALLTYRQLRYNQQEDDEETISGRLDWQSHWLDKHIRSDMTYAVSNSRELKREFVYMKVPTGQGTHTWRDLNGDGVQDLNEFFEAINPDERNYAKIFVPTNEFVTAFQNLLICQVMLDMPRSWSSSSGLKKLLSRFSNNTSWSTDIKTTDSDPGSRLLAFAKEIDEMELLREKSSVRSTLFYNRASTKYGADFNFFSSDQRQLLSNGFEFRGLEEYSLNFRVNLSRQYNFNMGASRAKKQVSSDFLEGRNYLIASHKLSPEMAWQPRDNFRISVQYGYESKENVFTPESTEEALINEFILNLKLNKAVKSTFNARVRWVEIDFTGEESSPIGYDLLNALRPGRNITWGINWQQHLTSGLQVNLSYDGRKSEDTPVIHIGRVQVSALF